jgi:hypothetical protein
MNACAALKVWIDVAPRHSICFPMESDWAASEPELPVQNGPDRNSVAHAREKKTGDFPERLLLFWDPPRYLQFLVSGAAWSSCVRSALRSFCLPHSWFREAVSPSADLQFRDARDLFEAFDILGR